MQQRRISMPVEVFFMEKTACAYLRVSDERQDEYSPDSQRKRIEAYARQHDLLLHPRDIYCDDGISAKTARNRTAFQQMLAKARHSSHPYDVILVWKFSRFARNQEESIVYKNLLRKIGVEVISVSEPIGDDPFGALMERIIEWMDEYYLINLSAEVRRGMTEKAGRGEAMGQAVFGYERTAKSYVPNEDAPRVVQVFRAFCGGASPAALAEWLAAEGVRTGRGNPPSARWVRYLLQNPVYRGQVRWAPAGEAPVVVDGSHPAIVPEELFQAAQQRLAQKQPAVRQAGGGGLFAGLAYCSACGGGMVRAGAHPPVLQCSRYAKGRCRVSHSISVARFSRSLFAGLRPVLEPIPMISPPTDESGWLRRRKAAEARLRRAAAAYQSGADSLAEYQRTKARLTEEIAACTRQLNVLQRPASPPQNVWAWLQDDTAPEAQRQVVLRALVDRVIYHKATQTLEVHLRADPGQETAHHPGDRTGSWGHPSAT